MSFHSRHTQQLAAKGGDSKACRVVGTAHPRFKASLPSVSGDRLTRAGGSEWVQQPAPTRTCAPRTLGGLGPLDPSPGRTTQPHRWAEGAVPRGRSGQVDAENHPSGTPSIPLPTTAPPCRHQSHKDPAVCALQAHALSKPRELAECLQHSVAEYVSPNTESGRVRV